MTKNLFCQMEYKRDQEGKEILLKDGKFQVMMEWERPYMQACIDALKPTGDVLEIGFGCGYASTHIQTYHPKSHTIIEYHPMVAAKAREWAKAYPNVTIMEATWQDAMKNLGRFDAIFFDDYPLESEKEGNKTLEEKQKVHAILEKGRNTLREIEKLLPQLKSIKYTKQDLEDFFTQVEKQPPEMFLRFFSDLKKNGQIDDALHAYALTRSLELKLITQESLEQFNAPKPPFLFQHQGDRLFTFLQLCLRNHMKSGSVFSCYLEETTSKYEDPRFFDQIITNPLLEYREEWISVDVPAHCNYFKGNQALVMTIKLL